MTTRIIRHSSSVVALATCVLLTLASKVSAQERLATKPEYVGVSAQKVSELSSFMQGLVDDGKIAGGVTMMARNGKVVHLEAVGMADREKKQPMRTDSIFRIASMTKPITSVAIMMLWEQGKADLIKNSDSEYVMEAEYDNGDVSRSVIRKVKRERKAKTKE